MTQKRFQPILFLVLIFLYGGLAFAAPSITADPNPVQISFLAKSGKTTITWDAGADHPKAQVWVSVDGTNEILWDQNYQGSKMVTIYYGKTHTYNLRTLNNQLLASVTVTVEKEDFKVPPNLPIFFIGNIVPEPHGTYAKIKFTTKTDSLPVALVSLKKPLDFPKISKNDEPMWNDPADVASTTFALPGTNHEATLMYLQPGKIYYYVLAAYDKQHKLWFKEKGAFITLQRQVNVTFEKVKVIDDSDDLSGGDLVFAFRINGELSPNGKDLTFGADIDSGESKNLNLQAKIMNPPSTMKINVVGFDDDETEWVPIGPFIMLLLNTCGKGAIDEKQGSGETDCGEWTGKTGAFDTTILADGEDPNAPVTQSFVVKAYPTEDDSELAFEVSGKYTITYVFPPLSPK